MRGAVRWQGAEKDLVSRLPKVVSLAVWAGLKACLDSIEPEPLFRFLRYDLLGSGPPLERLGFF